MDTITVKPNLTLAVRIADGKYDWTNDNITEGKFPNDPTTIGEWEYRLIHPNQNTSSETANTLCEADGWQAAQLEHLLAFGEKFPEKQKAFPIVSLGSVCELDFGRHVPELWFNGYERKLNLNYWHCSWGSSYRFLSVRKISVS